MKILVTGGAGFIGSHIVDAYIRTGHEVTVVDDLSTGNRDNLNPAARFVELDIAGPALEQVFQSAKFEVVNHHAAQINVRRSLEDPVFDARVNVIGSLNVINLACRSGVKRVIFSSSGGAVYGEPDTFPITEEFPTQPLSPYGVAKLTTEHYLSVYRNLYGLDYVVFRYSNVYGPRQISKSEAGVISIFINQILNGDTCWVNGDGEQVRDYVFVADVVEANLQALDCPTGCINIGTGQTTSVNELIEILSGITGRSVLHQHRPAIPGEVLKNVLDASRARSLLTWEPRVSIQKGIRQTFDYFSQAHVKTR